MTGGVRVLAWSLLLLGTLLTVAGAAMLVLPGPGLLVRAAGLPLLTAGGVLHWSRR